jgi:alpha-L-rhamnosidase
MLGDGWWSGFVGWQETRGQYGTLQNSLLLQLEVELANGATFTVVTDNSWRCETGPVLSSDFMMGERYDARRGRAGWDRPAFDDSTWLPTLTVAPSKVHIPKFGFSRNQPGDTEADLPLVAQRSEPVRVVETLPPVSVKEVRPGVFIYDLGQNIAGWMRITLSAPAGTCVTLRHAERLNPDGTLYTENLRRAKATDVYICKGSSDESWQPRFTFHGFQYVEVTVENPSSEIREPKIVPTQDARGFVIRHSSFEICLTGCVVMSATPPAGQFECSHPLVTRLWKNALWGQKG